MSFRKILHSGIFLLAVVLIVSYAYAAYMLYVQVRPHSPAELKASTVPSREVPVEALIKDADQKLQKHDVEQALVEYRKALSAEPKSLNAQLGLARGEYLAGREEVSAREFEKALSLAPKDDSALLQVARIYSHRSATWAQAESRYKAYLALKPDDAEAQLELARVSAWRGNSKEAIELFSRKPVAHLMNYSDSRAFVFGLIKSGRTDEALSVLKGVTESHPSDWEMQLQLADLYAKREDWPNALATYRQLMSRRPHDARIALDYGLALLANRNYKAALAPLAQALAADPSSREAALAHARALKGVGDLKAAAREFDRIVPGYTNNAAILREYGDLLMETRNYRKSEKYYRMAYDRGLRDERLLIGLAGAMRGRGRDKEALPYLEEAYRLHPSDRLAFELAQAYRKAGKYDRALALLNKIEKRS